MSSDPVLAYQNESRIDGDDGRPLRILAEYLQPLEPLPRERIAAAAQRLIRPYSDSLIPQSMLTLQPARASCAVGKVGFRKGLLGRGLLDREGSVR